MVATRRHEPSNFQNNKKEMEAALLKEFQDLKNLTMLGVKDVFTMNDVALYTDLSKSHLYKLVMRKEIPYYKSNGGKLTYFDKEEVKAWMLQHRVKTTDELEAEAANYVVNGKTGKGGKK